MENRLDPSRLTLGELRELDRLGEVVMANERPALLGRDGARINLPKAISRLLALVVCSLQEGKAMLLVPESQVLTAQAAADYLGVSRPLLVRLLDKGVIPHHRVGTRRRVCFKDLLEYRKKRGRECRQAMNRLFKTVDEAGVYAATLPPENES
jgi:excisionase family DNA binding protein